MKCPACNEHMKMIAANLASNRDWVCVNPLCSGRPMPTLTRINDDGTTSEVKPLPMWQP